MGSELPSSVEARCYTDTGIFTHNLADCDNADTSSHGTAVTEAAFDIAPEATYYIANPKSYGDLAVAVDWMIDHDVDTINYSLSEIWSGPGDGTSPYSNSSLRTVDAAVAGGITWVNAAGNFATETWFGDFSDPDGNGYHNFTENDNCNTFVVDEGNPYIWAFLRWDDAWQGSDEDLDLELYRVFSFIGTTLRIHPILAGGVTFQDGESSKRCYTKSLRPTLTCSRKLLRLPRLDPATWSSTTQLHIAPHGASRSPTPDSSGELRSSATLSRSKSSVRQGPTPDDRVKPDIVGADKVHSAALW